MPSNTPDLIPAGWQETVISVTDIGEMQKFFIDILGWELRSSGELEREMLNAWRLAPSAQAKYALVAAPDANHGFVRILEFDGVEQKRIRDHAQAWETGGIFNLNIRVAHISDIEPAITDAGWQAPSAPVNFNFGSVEVWEWIPCHKDSVRVALVERVSPPLESGPIEAISAPAFNSTQVVKNMDKAMAFYRDILGFKTYYEYQGTSDVAQDHVLGLSREAMMQVVRDVRILNPGENHEGSVELLEFENYSGRDFADKAVPPNLGNLMLRYPVPDIDKLDSHVRKAGITPEFEAININLAPYGPVRLLGIRAPDGAWLEFFQRLT